MPADFFVNDSAKNFTTGLSIVQAHQLILTVESDALVVCPDCSYLHIRMLSDARPENLRRFARALVRWAAQLERKAPK